MPKAYSGDLRVRVIEMVRAGASRREAAEVFSLANSTAVKWLQRWEKPGVGVQCGRGLDRLIDADGAPRERPGGDGGTDQGQRPGGHGGAHRYRTDTPLGAIAVGRR